MTELQIIGAPQSNFVWVTRITCTEKGVPHALVPAMPHTPQIDAITAHAWSRASGRELIEDCDTATGERICATCF